MSVSVSGRDASRRGVVGQREKDGESVSKSSVFSSATLKQKKESIAVSRIQTYAPVEDIEERVELALEQDFFDLQSHADEHSDPSDHLPNICEGFSAGVAGQLNGLRNLEAQFFVDVPRSNADYQRLRDLEKSLSLECLVWNVIIALSKCRDERSLDPPLGPDPNISTEEQFVTALLHCEPVTDDIRAVLVVLEDNYAESHPAELLLPNTAPSHMRIALQRELNTIGGKRSAAATKDSELGFERMFRSLRGGDLAGAADICRHGGYSVFGVNFVLSRWSSHGPAANMTNNENRRLRWKRTALLASKDATLGIWERAVWGVLAGNYRAALPVAETWEDEAWAHFKGLQDVVAESALLRSRNHFSDDDLNLFPEEYWMQRLSVSEVFAKLDSSKYLGRQSEKLFHQSVKYAIVNDLKDALKEIETFMIHVSECLPVEGLQRSSAPDHLTKQVRNGLRFAFHILLVIRSVGLHTDDIFWSRLCYLYVQVTASTDASLWAFYLTKIPQQQQQVSDDSIVLRYDAVSTFLDKHLERSSDKTALVKALLPLDRELAVLISKSFVRKNLQEYFWNIPLSAVEVLTGLFDTFSDDADMLRWLLRETNLIIRSLLLAEPPQAEEANIFRTAAQETINRVLSLSTDEFANDAKGAQAEFVCWERYLGICSRFSEWDALKRQQAQSGVDNADEIEVVVQDIVSSGFTIFSTTDWLSAPSLDEERKRPNQLRVLRSRTLAQVYCSLLTVLWQPLDDIKDNERIKRLENMLSLTDLMAGYVSSGVVEADAVSSAFDDVHSAIEDVFSRTALASLLRPRLKEKMKRFKPPK